MGSCRVLTLRRGQQVGGASEAEGVRLQQRGGWPVAGPEPEVPRVCRMRWGPSMSSAEAGLLPG